VRAPRPCQSPWRLLQTYKVFWNAKKATATAAPAVTGDSNPFWLTASTHAVAAAAAGMPPKPVIDSRVSRHMCNDRSGFSMIKKLSLLVVIDLGDNNSVTAMHYGFVEGIQRYQVKALHTSTFRLSHLSINQLDLGWHMTIFQDGKCSITSPSSCTLAGNPINGIYVIVPATALLSSTTEKETNRRWESSLSRVLITEPINTEPTITSSNPPGSSASSAHSTVKTYSTRKCLTISESRIWHRWLAHMNPTTMNSLIDRYTHDDSMCTVFIQAKRNQRCSRVPVKRITKPFELVKSDLCSPLFHWPSETISIIHYWSSTTQGSHPYGCSQMNKLRPAHPPTCDFRAEWTQWDTRWTNSGVIMNQENITMRPSNMSSRLEEQHTRHALHTLTITIVLTNWWSIQSLKQLVQWW